MAGKFPVEEMYLYSVIILEMGILKLTSTIPLAARPRDAFFSEVAIFAAQYRNISAE